jgi:hypothetical protein
MPTSYLTIPRLKLLSQAPAAYFVEIDTREAGWTAAQIELHSEWINGKLRKRYDAPFAAPYPTIVEGWVAALVTAAAYHKRGVDATDEQVTEVIEAANRARTEVDEAANSAEGRFDLPLRADTTASGISKGAPLFYSETSPYKWRTEQRRIGRGEDGNG